MNVIQFGQGPKNFVMISGVMEMIARTIAGLLLAPRFGFAALCFAHPLAWLFADCFLIPAFFVCKAKIGKRGGKETFAQ